MSRQHRSKIKLYHYARILADCPTVLVGVVFIFIGVLGDWLLNLKKSNVKKPRLLWGTTPIKNLTYLSRALTQAGFYSKTAVLGTSAIYAKQDFDYHLTPATKLGRFANAVLGNLRAYYFFMTALWRFDIFHYFFDGGVLRKTLLNRLELPLLRLTGKRIILMPYGSDAFVYDLIPNPIWRHVLSAHYPECGDQAAYIQKRLRRMSKQADIVVGCLFHFVNLPRWDILPLTCYPIDTNVLQPVAPNTSGAIRIAHATNHRTIKGTEFLQAAVKQLQLEDFPIILDIIEKVPNEEALQRIAQADIYVDQLVIGYALAALEGMALGKVVISTLEDNPAYNLFRQYSYLNECPIIAANTQNIYAVLKTLFQQRQYWPKLGNASRQFVEKRHSLTASAEMFGAIYNKIWDGQEVDLINFYHPLLQQPNCHSSKETVIASVAKQSPNAS